MQTIFRTAIKPLSVGIFTLALAACGGGGGENKNGSGSGNQQGGATNKNHGITGDVNGTTYNYNGDTRYTNAGDQKRSINGENIDNGNESWSLFFVPEKVGSYSCGEENLTLALTRENNPSGTATSCTVQVTQADETGLFGTFTATLNNGNNVTNGAFKIIFEDAIGDADEDGLSDAEDNCAFMNNPDQADSDTNGIGDVCDIEMQAEEEEEANKCSPQTDPSTLPNCGVEALSQLCAVPGLNLLIGGLAPGTC